MNKVLCLFDTKVDRGERHLLLGLKAAGYDPYVLCNPPETQLGVVDELRKAGIEVEIIPVKSKVDWKFMKRLRVLLRNNNFSLVHVFRKGGLANLTLATLGQSKPPVIAYRGIIGNLSYWDPFSWLTFLNPRLARIICVCEAIRKYFLDKKFLGVFHLFKPGTVKTIYKGHHVDWYAAGQGGRELLVKQGIPEESLIIGCVSRVQARKGIKELIECLPLIESEQKPHLVVLGHINDSSWKEAYESSPCKERIHVLGYHPDAAVMAGGFDIFTLPSLRREGLARSVIEAMSQEIPPVVSDAGGNPELVENEVSGLVVPAGDRKAMAAAFSRLLADPELRKKLGQEARSRIISHFTVQQTVDATLDLYKEVLSGKSKG